ncbi:MAG: tRNA preQ1(34) S-adenosylmethionine ribosyltransferase-isomerase QueA [Thermoflexales bacterium]|nr:tRNA preQ1(34) S-adenosylmethionine ribosyltransferase-isomerase QueA [Thermoflexales bacterium]
MLTSELDYDLPPELIAQHPIKPRDHARLLVCDRASQTHQHRRFYELPELLRPGDALVMNDTRVLRARLHGHKPTGGKVEVLLLRKQNERTWQALVGGRRVSRILFEHGLEAVVEEQGESGAATLTFNEAIEPHLERLGEVPLPPYIHEPLTDAERYQTVYARVAGSAAAPTAGLHFTQALLQRLEQIGIKLAFVTLHVGLDTFKPIDEETVEAHTIHSEWCELSEDTARVIQQVRGSGGRIVAVGTTSARVLETWAQARAQNPAQIGFQGWTSLYITPGYRWLAVDALITNFHLPRSTLLAMIGSFMGMAFMRQSYALAIQNRYRFYSFGDAMLIV